MNMLRMLSETVRIRSSIICLLSGKPQHPMPSRDRGNFTNSKYREHILEKHLCSVLICPTCGQTFGSGKYMRRHKEKCRGSSLVEDRTICWKNNPFAIFTDVLICSGLHRHSGETQISVEEIQMQLFSNCDLPGGVHGTI